MTFLKKNFFLSFINNLVIDHPTPSNISYLWNFGSLAGVSLVLQILTGLFLAMHYIPNIDLAFLSIEHIVRDVNYGWLLRYLHANGASFFFIIVYTHIFRAIYYGSFFGVQTQTWLIGVTIYLAMMASAFLGYVLPWGQMSLWGATVITNFFSVVPFVGVDVVTWLWGGFSVNSATLNRFFSLHFFFPFLIVALMILHLLALHASNHSNPLGTQVSNAYGNDNVENVSFFPFFILKDLFGILVFLLVLLYFAMFLPNFLGHPDNYIPANSLSTPAHIVPEWYFLPFYAILRSIPNKILGVIFMFLSILTLYFLPFFGSNLTKSAIFRPIFKKSFWFFVVNSLILGWLGGNPVEFPFYQLGQFCTIFYFSFFYFFLPVLSYFERLYIFDDEKTSC